MKITEHVEHLLRQGRKPRELIELDFPKQVVTKVRRQLKEKATSQAKRGKGGTEAESRPQSAVTTAVEAQSGFLESKVRELEERVQASGSVMSQWYLGIITGSLSSKLPTTDFVLRGSNGILRLSPSLAISGISSPKVTNSGVNALVNLGRVPT